jgi:hypothetical protein
MEIYALGNANKNLEALNFLPTFDRSIQDREMQFSTQVKGKSWQLEPRILT